MPGKPLVGAEGAGNHIWNAPTAKDRQGNENAGGANGHVLLWPKRPKWVKGVASQTAKQAQQAQRQNQGNSI